MKIKYLNLYAILILLSGCCTKGCDSYCKCEPPTPDEYTASLNPKHIELLTNLQYKKEVFKNAYRQVDTIVYSSLKYQNIVSAGSKCNKPHQTCCNKLYFEQYFVMFSTKTLSIPNYYGLSIDSRSPNAGLDSRYMYGLFPDTVRTIEYRNMIYNDAFINISKSTKDTIGLVSISKGVLIFTDDRKQKWNRIL